MNYSSWKKWLGSLPWSRRWFVFLVLLRPIADNFYYLKQKSPFYSPPFIIGLMFPIIVFFTLLFKRSKLPFTSTDIFFLLWSFFLFMNGLFLFFKQPTLTIFGTVLQITVPSYTYFYLRYFVRSKEDLSNILQTCIYAAGVPALLLLYETLFSPFNVEYSRGIIRVYGGYADILNYGIYVVLTILIFGYFLLIPNKKIFLKRGIFKIILIFSVCLLGLIRIAHGATYGVFIILIAIFSFYIIKSEKLKGLTVILVLIPLVFLVFRGIYKERIVPLVESDIRVWKGELGIERAFHGRGGRWVRTIPIFAELPILVRFFGPPISNNKETSILFEISPHNDFVRILFYTGILGLLSYLLILLTIFIKSFGLSRPEKFLVHGSLLIIIIYSITTHPMYYHPLLYILFAVFAYTCIAKASYVKFTFSRYKL